MIDVRGYLSAERITDLKSTTKEGAIMELVALAAGSPAVTAWRAWLPGSG